MSISYPLWVCMAHHIGKTNIQTQDWSTTTETLLYEGRTRATWGRKHGVLEHTDLVTAFIGGPSIYDSGECEIKVAATVLATSLSRRPLSPMSMLVVPRPNTSQKTTFISHHFALDKNRSSTPLKSWGHRGGVGPKRLGDFHFALTGRSCSGC